MKFDKNTQRLIYSTNSKHLNMIQLPVDSRVDIHLTNGTLARGTVAASNEDIIVLGCKPAIHSVHGILEFEKVTIDRKHVIIIGFRNNTNEY